jgi:hypothetical protein
MKDLNAGQRGFGAGLGILATLLIFDGRYPDLSLWIRYPLIFMTTLVTVRISTRFMEWICDAQIKGPSLSKKDQTE